MIIRYQKIVGGVKSLKYYVLYDFQLDGYTYHVDTDKERLTEDSVSWWYDMNYDNMVENMETILDRHIEIGENEKYLYENGFEIVEIKEKLFKYIRDVHDWKLTENRLSTKEVLKCIQ